MFKLSIRANGSREVIAQVSDTILNALEANNISINGATVSFNGRILNTSEFNKTFADMGAQSGGTGILSVVVKADSAC